ncbi:hypothetical protein L202_06078 [Cryptococcus amylolentus CBS 6039]|uniref:Uncharacterized protein n=1 Tax=Cryptococcus amylolentus CBS 6039 TaxID=1295533 RepID=A0A1E3HJ38_9TREE|nr:hypothetical protein L202_06078 [Cryptococcus amylolentus CBS 6039]ODN76155.1 hypothetical protein L202_06078 [Cryptococcus amylolentus CBS 6039]
MSNFLTATYPFAADHNLDDLSDNEQTIPLLLLQTKLGEVLGPMTLLASSSTPVLLWIHKLPCRHPCSPLSTGVLFQTVSTGVFSTTHPTSIWSHLVSAPPSVSAGARQKADEMRASQKASRTRDKEE